LTVSPPSGPPKFGNAAAQQLFVPFFLLHTHTLTHLLLLLLLLLLAPGSVDNGSAFTLCFKDGRDMLYHAASELHKVQPSLPLSLPLFLPPSLPPSPSLLALYTQHSTHTLLKLEMVWYFTEMVAEYVSNPAAPSSSAQSVSASAARAAAAAGPKRLPLRYIALQPSDPYLKGKVIKTTLSLSRSLFLSRSLSLSVYL
jgi:hypothetical protein